MDQSSLYFHIYSILCLAASTAIDFIDEKKYAEARKLLEDALEEAEDYYIDQTIAPYPGAYDLPRSEVIRIREWCRQFDRGELN